MEFLTLKQASVETGKSEITIRRLVKGLLNQKNTPILAMTTQLPNLNEQMIRREKTATGFVYSIEKRFLFNKLKLPFLVNSQSGGTAKVDDSNEQIRREGKEELTREIIKSKDEVIAILKEQISQKDTQIKHLAKVSGDMAETQKQTNFILKREQDRVLLLESGGEDLKNNVSGEATTIEAEVVNGATPRKEI